jgi:hypothetical protein
MLSGIGSPKGTLRITLLSAADAGGEVGVALGHAEVTMGLGASVAEDELPLQPVTAARTAPSSATGTTFTVQRYVKGNDTICW